MSIRAPLTRGLAGLAFLAFVLLAGRLVEAEPAYVPTGDAPVVEVGIGSGKLVINTWDQPGVAVQSNDDVSVRKAGVRFGNEPGATPSTVQMLAAPLRTPQGDTVTLPPETFVFSTVQPGVHDTVVLNAADATATIHVPANTALVVVRSTGSAQIAIDDYRQGTFIVHARAGTVRLANDAGDGFVQVVNGNVVARNSNFNRIRVRTALRNISFVHCDARQIEATSIGGSILYDGGTFQPGLAHFSSERGNVAIGVAGGARIAARGPDGRVFSQFDGPATVQQRDGLAQAVVGNGGAFVNASSAQGSVYLYDGSLSRAQPREAWQAIEQRFQRPGAAPRTGLPPYALPQRPGPAPYQRPLAAPYQRPAAAPYQRPLAAPYQRPGGVPYRIVAPSRLPEDRYRQQRGDPDR